MVEGVFIDSFEKLVARYVFMHMLLVGAFRSDMINYFSCKKIKGLI